MEHAGTAHGMVMDRDFLYFLAGKAGSLCCEGLTLHSGCRGQDQRLGIACFLPDQGKNVRADALPLAPGAGAGGAGHRTCL